MSQTPYYMMACYDQSLQFGTTIWRTPLSFCESLASGDLNEAAYGCGEPFLYALGLGCAMRGSADLLPECDQFMQIIVRDNNVDQALRALKKKLQREGVYREMKLRRHYEKPSEKRAREKAAAVRRARKMDRKRMERDGTK
jgi:small subunit ribosomal protein S21